MHKLTVTISATLYDPHGKLIRKFRPRAAHSFLAQFIEMLHMQMSQSVISTTRITGDERAASPLATAFTLIAGASDLTWGILIGNGTTPVDIDDYCIESQITADLTASVHTFLLSYPTANSRRTAISRTFTNASVAPIPIEEVVLYSKDASGTILCFDRTLYSVSIPASSSLELTYRITVSV